LEIKVEVFKDPAESVYVAVIDTARIKFKVFKDLPESVYVAVTDIARIKLLVYVVVILLLIFK